MEVNGTKLDQAAQMQEAMRRFEQFVGGALDQAVKMLSPGYKATVIFSYTGDPKRDIVISAARLDDVVGALVTKMKEAGLALPKGIIEGSVDEGLAMVNLVTAVRRTMPFITGPGSDIAKKMLGQALSAHKASETAREVVAAYLAEVPGTLGLPATKIEAMLVAAEAGHGQAALVFHANPEAGTTVS